MRTYIFILSFIWSIVGILHLVHDETSESAFLAFIIATLLLILAEIKEWRKEK